MSHANYGDINCSGTVSLADLTCLIDILMGDTTNNSYDYDAADVNSDFSTTIKDVDALQKLLMEK